MTAKQMEKLERLETEEKWTQAITLNKKLVEADPRSHWLLTNLSSNYYEARDYREALKYSRKALKLAPQCPLALWDHAGALDMLDKGAEARKIYKKLLGRSFDSLAYGECGEGKRWTESLLNDCRVRLGLSFAEDGYKKQAVASLKDHLKHRRPGLPSLYSKADIMRALKQIKG